MAGYDSLGEHALGEFDVDTDTAIAAVVGSLTLVAPAPTIRVPTGVSLQVQLSTLGAEGEGSLGEHALGEFDDIADGVIRIVPLAPAIVAGVHLFASPAGVGLAAQAPQLTTRTRRTRIQIMTS